MDLDANWNAARDGRATVGLAGAGILRFALLFGSAAVALSLIAIPLLDQQVRPHFAGGVDRMTTGSIPRPESYTIRRSVLQSSPNAICVIRANGTRSGDCG